MNILIIEDHQDIGRRLRDHLLKGGHNVDWAPDLGSASAALDENLVDFLLCDIELPDGNGWEFFGNVAAPRPYAVAMSGYGDKADLIRSEQAGFCQHLTKPFDMEELEDLIRKAARWLALNPPR